MGLLNRVCAKGAVRAEAERLALTIAMLPQACMLADRQATYGQEGLSLDAALAEEFAGARAVLENSAQRGAQRFVDAKRRRTQNEPTP